ncbi:DUF1868 domain-containing protein [Corynebacterium sp. c25Ua_47]|uniref:DUF1868 domain-containing protein n=1 Tax=Corynebacterium sp. c25Ua_47 TaxID=3032353 RepID=UPI0032651A7F
MSVLPLAPNQKTFEKFTPNGVAKRHRGSTFVAHVVPNSKSYQMCERIQKDVRERGLGEHFALLPPSSFHMTVYPGLKGREFEGEEDRWPDWLKAAPTMTAAAGLMYCRLRENSHQIPELPELRMRPTGVYDLGISLTVGLEPADDDMAVALNHFRETLRDLLEAKDKDLDSYKFHCSLGYRLTDPELTSNVNRELSELYTSWAKELNILELERPAFNVFDDMLAFPPLMFF